MMTPASAAATVVALVVTVASPHTLVLTVSHGWPVADSQFTAVVTPPIRPILAALSAFRA